MAKNTKVSAFLFVFLFVFFLVVHSVTAFAIRFKCFDTDMLLKVIADMVVGMKGIEKVCRRRSKTWSGYCGDSKHCDQQCREWEGAEHGACHHEGLGRACFCYFNC
ncbi:Gamma thionin [Cynara cardunculus var. scolymus]|uniref:Gamma thionin n=1 Tax=Cynara cardunculus var. scolymus TaxID=59895 RepID=A0A124SF31_CYNCS|nr:Gamma thionin [Cynara cardunculus var. scolymus]